MIGMRGGGRRGSGERADLGWVSTRGVTKAARVANNGRRTGRRQGARCAWRLTRRRPGPAVTRLSGKFCLQLAQYLRCLLERAEQYAFGQRVCGRGIFGDNGG